MGLDISYGAFNGSYLGFDRFRDALCRAMGGSWPPHDDSSLDDEFWYWGDDYGEDTHPGLQALLSHSDCDGIIPPKLCAALADELTALLPALASQGIGAGHIQAVGGYEAVAKRFIAGCRKAAKSKKGLAFR